MDNFAFHVFYMHTGTKVEFTPGARVGEKIVPYLIAQTHVVEGCRQSAVRVVRRAGRKACPAYNKKGRSKKPAALNLGGALLLAI